MRERAWDAKREARLNRLRKQSVFSLSGRKHWLLIHYRLWEESASGEWLEQQGSGMSGMTLAQPGPIDWLAQIVRCVRKTTRAALGLVPRDRRHEAPSGEIAAAR